MLSIWMCINGFQPVNIFVKPAEYDSQALLYCFEEVCRLCFDIYSIGVRRWITHSICSVIVVVNIISANLNALGRSAISLWRLIGLTDHRRSW